MITFETFINKYIAYNISSNKLITALSTLSPIFTNIRFEDNDKFIKVLKCFHKHICGCHFNDYFTIEQVNNMYHTKSNGTICKGEKYDYEYAKKIYDSYVCKLNTEANVWNVYVAINAQYHDHIIEYTNWFGNITKSDMDCKIIDAAITFWFRDEDSGDNKVWNYFKNIG